MVTIKTSRIKYLNVQFHYSAMDSPTAEHLLNAFRSTWNIVHMHRLFNIFCNYIF